MADNPNNPNNSKTNKNNQNNPKRKHNKTNTNTNISEVDYDISNILWYDNVNVGAGGMYPYQNIISYVLYQMCTRMLVGLVVADVSV